MSLFFQGLKYNNNGLLTLNGDAFEFYTLSESCVVNENSMNTDIGITAKDVSIRFTGLIENGNLNISTLMDLFQDNDFVRVNGTAGVGFWGFLDYTQTTIDRDDKGITTLIGQAISPLRQWEQKMEKERQNGVNVSRNLSTLNGIYYTIATYLRDVIFMQNNANAWSNTTLPTTDVDAFGIDEYPVALPDSNITTASYIRPSIFTVYDNRENHYTIDGQPLVSDFINNWQIMDGYRLKWDWQNNKYVWEDIKIWEQTPLYLDTNLLSAEQSYQPIINTSTIQGIRYFFDNGYWPVQRDPIGSKIKDDLDLSLMSAVDFGYVYQGNTSNPQGRQGEIVDTSTGRGWDLNLYSIYPEKWTTSDIANGVYLNLSVQENGNGETPLKNYTDIDPDVFQSVQVSCQTVERTIFQLGGTICTSTNRFAENIDTSLHNSTINAGTWEIWWLFLSQPDGSTSAGYYIGGPTKSICHHTFNPVDGTWSFQIDSAVNDQYRNNMQLLGDHIDFEMTFNDKYTAESLLKEIDTLQIHIQRTVIGQLRTIQAIYITYSAYNGTAGLQQENPYIYEVDTVDGKDPYEIHTQKPLWQLLTNNSTQSWSPQDTINLPNIDPQIYNKRAVINVSTKELLQSGKNYSIYTGLENQYTVPQQMYSKGTINLTTPQIENNYEMIYYTQPV